MMRSEMVLVAVLTYVLPAAFVLWVSWRMWRVGRPARGATVERPRTCRGCGLAGPLHPKTGRCAECHAAPLPDRSAVPDHLPASFDDVRAR
jgi:hypothetical protein